MFKISQYPEDSTLTNDQANLYLNTWPDIPVHEKQNTQYKPCASQLPSASSRKSVLRSNGRSSGGNGSEVQEVVERLGLAKDGEALGPKKHIYTESACSSSNQNTFSKAIFRLF